MSFLHALRFTTHRLFKRVRVSARTSDEWNEMRDFVTQCEVEQLDLVGLSIDAPKYFWRIALAIDANIDCGTPRDEAASTYGFCDYGHYQTVCKYLLAKWSHRVVGSHGIQIELQPHCAQALLDEHKRIAGLERSLLAAEVRALEPIDGATIEQWATGAAIYAGFASDPDQLDARLAQIGLTQETYLRVNAAWQQRMANDKSHIVAPKFSDIFTAALAK